MKFYVDLSNYHPKQDMELFHHHKEEMPSTAPE